MSKINKQKNTVSKKKVQEPIGTRIAKTVFEEKKISERIFGYISYDISFVKATYAGKTQRPAKITSLEKGIVGILLALLAVFGVADAIDISAKLGFSPAVSNILSLVEFALIIFSVIKFSLLKKRNTIGK